MRYALFILLFTTPSLVFAQGQQSYIERTWQCITAPRVQAAETQPENEVLGTSTEVQSSEQIQNTIASYSPATASTLSPLFKFIDTAREKGALALDGQLSWAKEKVGQMPKPGLVAGAQSGGDWKDTIFFVVYTLYFYILTVIRFLLANAGLFYPVAVIIFFLVLWKLFRRIRRPAY